MIPFEEITNKDGFYITVNLEDTLPQTSTNYGICFIAVYPCEVMAVKEVHGTSSASGTVILEKLTGTTAKASGTVISTISTAGSVNTVLTGTLVTNARQLNTGDRLALKSGGTLTNLKDLQVTIYLKRLGKGDYR